MRAHAAIVATILAGCGADPSTATEPPPPPTQYPAPVGSVSILGAPVPVVFVGETVQLMAVVRNFAGAPLAGRAVSWTGSGNATFTLSPAGHLVVYSPGNINVTATVEDKSTQVSLIAGYGDSLLAYGGTVAYPGHASLVLARGSVVTDGRIGVVPTSAVPTVTSDVSGKALLPSTYVEFYPRNQVFGLPYVPAATVEGTLTLSYNPATLPAGYDQKRLVIGQLRNGVLTAMSPVTVDTIAHTLTTTHVQGLFGYGVAY